MIFNPNDNGLREELLILSLKLIYIFDALNNLKNKIRIFLMRKLKFKSFTLKMILGLQDSLILDLFDWLLISLTAMVLGSCSWLYLGFAMRDILPRNHIID